MDPQELSSQELVQLCLAQQDEAMWLEFVRRFQPLIAGVVLKSIRRWARVTPEVVDDLVHDTYVKLFANNCRALRRFNFEHDHSFFGFLKCVASNVVQDHLRSTYSQKRGSGRDDEDLEVIQHSVAADNRPADAMEREVLIREIEKCLVCQPSDDNVTRDCTLFWLYYRQGLTAKAISRLPGIGLTVKGVESSLLRTTRLVRERMGNPPLRKKKTSGRDRPGKVARQSKLSPGRPS
ncbi:MAG: sigma-70 family RNA polymerase sigma factor [Acidobacteriia bacterium]|nr:sigma-70 family RNA polymerase sigma factor [Terriglobia bacterium]